MHVFKLSNMKKMTALSQMIRGEITSLHQEGKVSKKINTFCSIEGKTVNYGAGTKFLHGEKDHLNQSQRWTHVIPTKPCRRTKYKEEQLSTKWTGCIPMLGIACRGLTHIINFFFKQHILSAIWILWRFNFICRIS